eukprot:5260796-Alexandrium_andersonii.AAC.1
MACSLRDLYKAPECLCRMVLGRARRLPKTPLPASRPRCEGVMLWIGWPLRDHQLRDDSVLT